MKKPRHPRRPQLPLDGIDPPVRRLVHTAVHKQKLAQYIDALKLYETHLDDLNKDLNKLLLNWIIIIINSPLQNCVNLNRLRRKIDLYPL